METKKLGFVLVGLTALSSIVIFNYIGNLGIKGQQYNCNPTQQCQSISSMLGISHIIVGLLAFIFALGFYLLFFSKGEQEILKRLEEDKLIDTRKDQFEMLLKPMDDNEGNILRAIKDQEGITQTTLKFRVNLSKAKVSEVITRFEKNGLISRNPKGKTYEIFLRDVYA